MSNGQLFRSEFVKRLVARARRRRTLPPQRAGKIETIETRPFDVVDIGDPPIVTAPVEDEGEPELELPGIEERVTEGFDSRPYYGDFTVFQARTSVETPTLVIEADASRFMLLLRNSGAVALSVAPEGVADSNFGVPLNPGGQSRWRYFFEGGVVGMRWFGVSSGGATFVTVLGFSFTPKV